MGDYILLTDAAETLGVPYRTLQRQAQRGSIPAFKTNTKRGMVWAISHATLSQIGPQSSCDYDRLLAQYLDELAAGVISGRPTSPRYRQTIVHNLCRYWDLLGEHPSIEGLSAEGFRRAMMAIRIDEVNRRDYAPLRRQIYKSIRGFYRLLIREGFKSQQDRDALGSAPRARFEKRSKNYPVAEDFWAFVELNLSYKIGRSDFDVALMHTLICLYGLAGVRKMEAAALVFKDVDFEGQALRVWGKGGARRMVPAHPYLLDTLKSWLSYRQTIDTPNNLLLVGANGVALTQSAIQLRFARLGAVFKKTKPHIDIHPHALRHACATILALSGMPTVLIQHFLGHTDLKTTNIYLNPTTGQLFEQAQKLWAR